LKNNSLQSTDFAKITYMNIQYF